MIRDDLIEGYLTYSVIGAFYEVSNTLGLGFLEYLYVMALERELLARGHRVAREVSVQELGTQRLDMIVDERLIVETKSTYELRKAALRQVYNYLRATLPSHDLIRLIRSIRCIQMNLLPRSSAPRTRARIVSGARPSEPAAHRDGSERP